MSPTLFFIFFFTCTGVEKIFLQINSAAVAFIDILIAAWEGLKPGVTVSFFPPRQSFPGEGSGRPISSPGEKNNLSVSSPPGQFFPHLKFFSISYI